MDETLRFVEAASIPPSSPEEEAELARGVKAGSEAALNGLLQRHWIGLVRYALRFLDRQDEAEDIAQEAFVRLWSRRGSWRQEETLRPVLYRIARNLALNEKRRRANVRRLGRKIGRPEQDPRPPPHRQMQRADLEVAVQSAVDGLSPRRREIFLLVRMHQMSHREVGQVLGISPQTVANQISQVMKDLREALEPYLEEADPEEIPFRRAGAG